MLPALGIDYGRVHLGLAIAIEPLAQPLAALSKTRMFSLLPELVSRHHLRTIIIGLPDGELHAEVAKFAVQIGDLLPAPKPQIICFDETLSTHDAIEALSHTSPRARKLKEHSAAAAIILQSWIDSWPSSDVKSG